MRPALLAALLSALPARAAQYPPPAGPVNDFAGVLSADDRAHIGAVGYQLERDTYVELAVVTVRATSPDTPRGYARGLMRQWHLGKPGMDNGLLILVSVDERLLWIERGGALDYALPDERIDEIASRFMKPRIGRGDFARGLRSGVEAMAATITQSSQEPVAPRPRRVYTRHYSGPGWGVWSLLCAMGMLLVWLGMPGAPSGGPRADPRGGFGSAATGAAFGGAWRRY